MLFFGVVFGSNSSFSCEVADCVRVLIAIFWRFFGSIGGYFFVGEGGGWVVDYHSMGLDTFLMFPNFLRP